MRAWRTVLPRETIRKRFQRKKQQDLDLEQEREASAVGVTGRMVMLSTVTKRI